MDGRKTPHEHIPTEHDLEKRRAPGSEVRLHGEAETGMSQAAMDDIQSHRYEDSEAMRMRKIQNGGSSNDSYAPVIKMERLPRPTDSEAHELFVEMDELVQNADGLYEWRQKSRWIKYEEDVLEGADRWGKPHVASLSFHSMLQLRKCIETGAVILDMQESDLQGIANGIVDEMIRTEQLNPKYRGDVISSLLLKHSFMEDNKGFLRKSSTAYVGLVDLEDGNIPERKHSGLLGTKKYRFSDPYITLQNGKPHKESKSNDKVNIIGANGQGIVSYHVDHHHHQHHNRVISFSKFRKKYRSPSSSSQNKALQLDDDGSSSNLKRSQNLSGSTSSIKVDLDLMKKIPKGSQTTSVLVGQVDYLDKPIMAFVRLSRGRYLADFTQVPLPVRFIFILMGPSQEVMDYKDVGRSISTLMSNKKFHETAYTAVSRNDLLSGLNDFLDDSMVLPPGELDKKTLMPVLNLAKERARKKKQRKLEKEKALADAKRQEEGLEEEEPEPDPLARTGRLFGGMMNDMRKRFPLYLSDFKDGMNMQCLSAFFFIYFAALSPAITFGGLLGDKTEDWIGVAEMLAGVAFMGVIFHLTAAQPLLIVGFTGPLLVFEEGLYSLSDSVGLEYISFRVWVGFWLTAITVLVICFEGSFLVKMITRFTEEIFAALISLIFIIEVFVKLASIFNKHPLMEDYYEGLDHAAEFISGESGNTTTAMADDMWGNTTGADMTTAQAVPARSAEASSSSSSEEEDQPNTALLSFIETIGTFLIAYYLKKFRNGKYLGRTARRAIGDFGVPIAMLIMIVVDVLIGDNVYTEKLNVPDGLEPTDSELRGWFINPWGEEKTLPVWAYFAAAIPALLVFILIFMETMITNIIVYKKMTPENKGAGYHWSMMVIGLFGAVTGVLGLPFLTAATVRSVTHVNALQVFGQSHAPGEKPRLQEVKEQRVTGILVHIFIGVSVMLGPLLRKIPLPVLFGVFLYMGVASMSGVQLFDRMYLMFKPVKYHPDEGYVKNVRTWRMNLYTFFQIVALGVLWAVKSTQAALAFPFFLIMLVPVRKLVLTKIFSDQELDELDADEFKNAKTVVEYDSDEDDDFYTESHMPM